MGTRSSDTRINVGFKDSEVSSDHKWSLLWMPPIQFAIGHGSLGQPEGQEVPGRKALDQKYLLGLNWVGSLIVTRPDLTQFRKGWIEQSFN